MTDIVEDIVTNETRFEPDSPDFSHAVHAARVAWHKGFTAGLNGDAGDLLAACEAGADELDGPSFLEWIAGRMVHVYGESPYVDFVLTIRRNAARMRAAIAQAKGGPPP